MPFKGKPETTEGFFSDKFDDNRQNIDEEIKRLEDTIRTLKFRRNTFSPMNRLPPELISKISIMYAKMYQMESSMIARSSYITLKWVKISHICSHWRAVALGCPSLWSTISFVETKWSEEMLKRSMMASLDIQVILGSVSNPKKLKLVKTALTRISRIKSLDIFMVNPIGGFLENISGAAPILGSLSLSQDDDNDFTLPKDFLSGGTPSLRRLTLVRYNVMWESAFLQNLTHLKIHDVRLQCRPTTAQLIAVLQSMPLLEVLDLKDALPTFSSEATSVGPPSIVIDLPRLVQVYVESSMLECTNLFNHISFSPAAVLKLKCTGTEVTNDNVVNILTSLTSFISSRTDPIWKLSVDAPYPGCLEVKAWSYDRTESTQGKSIKPLDLSFIWMGLSSERVATIICEWLPLAELSSLYMAPYKLSTGSWLSTFGTLSKLQRITVYSDPATTLIDALRVSLCKTKKLARTIRPVVYFRGLRYLTIHQVNFARGANRNFERLRDALMLRCEEGAEVWQLWLKDCIYLYNCDVKLLKEIAVDVEWDYMEQGSSSDEYSDEDEDTDFDLYPYWFL